MSILSTNIDVKSRQYTLENQDLVCVPLYYYGFCNAAQNATVSGFNGSTYANAVGHTTLLYMTVLPNTTTATQRVAAVEFDFYGKAFGLRFEYQGGYSDPLDVIIDGITYPIDPTPYTSIEYGLTSYVDAWGQYIITNDLPDGEHHCRIVLTSDVHSNSQRYVWILGMLVQKRAGYESPPHPAIYIDADPLTTVASDFPVNSAERTMIQCSEIYYTNVATSSANVTIFYNGNPVWRKNVPSKDTVIWQPAVPIAYYGLWTHCADTSSCISASAVGLR